MFGHVLIHGKATKPTPSSFIHVGVKQGHHAILDFRFVAPFAEAVGFVHVKTLFVGPIHSDSVGCSVEMHSFLDECVP